MNWLRQNRTLGTLLTGLGICALLTGALFYWRWSAWRDAKQMFEQQAAEQSRLERLDPFPSEKNYQKLSAYLEHYAAALDNFKQALKAGSIPVPSLAPNEFQSRLRQAVLATFDRAQANDVKLPDKFQLGFDEFATVLPNTAAAPLLGQELSQIQILMNILLDARVDNVIAFHRAPLAEEHAPAATPTPDPAAVHRPVAAKAGSPAPPLIERNVVAVTFKAAPAAARKALNEIAASGGQFFIIRTLYVRNEKDKGPPRRATSAPAAVGQPPAGQPGGGGPLDFIVGNEHVEVSATIEMLRFAF